MLVTLRNDQIIPDGTAGLGDVLDTGGVGPLDVVGEGEEGIRAQSHVLPGSQPGSFLFRGQALRLHREVFLPDAVGAHVLFVAVDVAVNDVVTVGTTQIRPEGQAQGLGMLAQEPGVRLGACQTGAVDPGLLTGAHADGLTVKGKADGVTLGVFQGDQSHDQVNLGILGQFLVGSYDVFQQRRTDLEIVAALLEGDAEDLLGLLHLGNVVRVNGNDVVAALPLGLQNGQSFVGVAGGDDAVGNLGGDEGSGHFIADVGQGDPVTEGAHPVGAPGAGIGTGQRILVQTFHLVHKAGLFQFLRQGLAHGGGGGGDVLEGSGAGHSGGFLQLLHQLPGVQGIQEVDVAGAAVQNGDGQITAVVHVDGCRLLIGVAAVFQFKILHNGGSPSLSSAC